MDVDVPAYPAPFYSRRDASPTAYTRPLSASPPPMRTRHTYADASWAAPPQLSSSAYPSPYCSIRHAPLTPPRSSSPPTRRTSPANTYHPHHPLPEPFKPVMQLPPISHFDLPMAAMAPLTPPDSAMPHDPPPSITRTSPTTASAATYPPSSSWYPHANRSATGRDPHTTYSGLHHEQPDLTQSKDWFISDLQTHNAAHFLAEKMGEMVCYLWFSDATPLSARHSPSRPRTERSPLRERSNSATSALQFSPSDTFVQFLHKLLETTQVSLSVIVLSLHYIYRLKEQNRLASGLAGSEFRIAVAGLMMANKFLDDNTYTNKTWSEVSGIELDEVNRMETEFLSAVNFRLYVDVATYDSWTRMLKGLLNVKEQEARVWQQRLARKSHRARAQPTHSRSHCSRNQSSRASTRARSTSPTATRAQADDYSFTFVAPPSAGYSNARSSTQPHSSYHYQYDEYISTNPYRRSSAVEMTASSNSEVTIRPGSKRAANDAFSPTSATFAHAERPNKRPVSLHVEIPRTNTTASGARTTTYTPTDLSFSRLSLEPTSAVSRETAYSHSHTLAVPVTSTTTTTYQPANSNQQPTLAAPYRASDTRHITVPQHLYFYSLQGSATYSSDPEPEQDERDGVTSYSGYGGYGDYNRDKRSRLRYEPTTYQPPAAVEPTSHQPVMHLPMVVRSACASPRELHLLPPAQTLYPVQRTPRHASTSQAPTQMNGHSPQHTSGAALSHHQQQQQQQKQQQPYYSTPPYSMSHEAIPAAPFANAGPPGVQFYSDSASSSAMPTPSYGHGSRNGVLSGSHHAQTQSQRSSPLHYYYPPPYPQGRRAW